MAHNDMVLFEAAKSICELAPYLDNPIDAGFSMLQMLAGSTKPVVKYAALKIINKIAYFNSSLVLLCAGELEGMINHSNRSVASLAISALLKTCKPGDIHTLLHDITQVNILFFNRNSIYLILAMSLKLISSKLLSNWPKDIPSISK